MKFTTDRATLLAAVAAANEVSAPNSTIPALTMIRLDLEGNTLSLAATDMDADYRVSCPVEGAGDGSGLITAKRLSDILRALPEGAKVEMTPDASLDGILLKSGRSRFRLAVLPVDTFPDLPKMPDGAEFVLTEPEWRRLLAIPAPFMASDKTYSILCALSLSVIKGELVSWGTNRFCGARVALPMPLGAQDMPAIILPDTTARRLLKLASGDIRVQVSPSRIAVSWGSSCLSSKLVDGTFPDIDSLMPTTADLTATVKGADIRGACTRVGLIGADVTNAKARTVVVSIAPDGMTISGTSGGEAAEETVSAIADGEATLNFDPSFLVLAVTSSDCDEMTLRPCGMDKPTLMRPDGDDSVTLFVMPKR